MKLVPIPDAVRKAADKLLKKGDANPWWFVKEIPTMGIEAVSLPTGVIKPGVNLLLIGGHNREIYPNGKDKYSIHEYVGLMDHGYQALVQLGRDVEMTQ